MTERIHFIIQCLSTYYCIEVTSLTLFLVGADTNAFIYKAQARDQTTYFVKLRQGHSHDINIEVLKLLQKSGIQELIPPIKTAEGQYTEQMGDLTLIVYPFVQGRDGFTRTLTDKQWVGLGQALRQVHAINVPTSLQTRMRQEEFSPRWREAVRSIYTHTKTEPTCDEITLNVWKFLQKNKSMIQQLVACSEQLSQKARAHPLKYVLCHSDIHAGNVLIDDKGALYIVDWDDPILAPKERDLMFIGGGVGNTWNKPHEEKLFYQGYGQAEIDWTLLAYYRYERIVEDIAVYAQELLFKPTEGKDRREMYHQFMDMFAEGGVVDIAFATDKRILE
jgi:spectinomycin phosphotransferase